MFANYNRMTPVITTRRIYEMPAKEDGCRLLVDRLWPRGISREKAAIDAWEKELAPSTELRKWYDHTEERWPEFQKKYRKELEMNDSISSFLSKYHLQPRITLLYAAKTTRCNHALVLMKYLQILFNKQSPAR